MAAGAYGGNPTLSATEALIDEFRRRFPLFEKIVGEFGEDQRREQVPLFFAFLLAAANNPRPGGCCFLLDVSAGTTAIAAVLTALSRFKADFPVLIEGYAQYAFKRGERVRVLPSDAVFEYDGIWHSFPGHFRLKLMGRGGNAGFRSFPLPDVLRLEPTDRLRPMGTGATKLGQPAAGPMDQLLDLSSCGNNSIIRNNVLCQMPRAQFSRLIDSITLAPSMTGNFASLSKFLPWGSVDPDGRLHPNDFHQTVGEPLVAVSGIPADIACNCMTAPVGTEGRLRKRFAERRPRSAGLRRYRPATEAYPTGVTDGDGKYRAVSRSRLFNMADERRRNASRRALSEGALAR
jgi:hypothetical protein